MELASEEYAVMELLSPWYMAVMESLALPMSALRSAMFSEASEAVAPTEPVDAPVVL